MVLDHSVRWEPDTWNAEATGEWVVWCECRPELRVTVATEHECRMVGWLHLDPIKGPPRH